MVPVGRGCGRSCAVSGFSAGVLCSSGWPFIGSQASRGNAPKGSFQIGNQVLAGIINEIALNGKENWNSLWKLESLSLFLLHRPLIQSELISFPSALASTSAGGGTSLPLLASPVSFSGAGISPRGQEAASLGAGESTVRTGLEKNGCLFGCFQSYFSCIMGLHLFSSIMEGCYLCCVLRKEEPYDL